MSGKFGFPFNFDITTHYDNLSYFDEGSESSPIPSAQKAIALSSFIGFDSTSFDDFLKHRTTQTLDIGAYDSLIEKAFLEESFEQTQKVDFLLDDLAEPQFDKLPPQSKPNFRTSLDITSAQQNSTQNRESLSNIGIENMEATCPNLSAYSSLEAQSTTLTSPSSITSSTPDIQSGSERVLRKRKQSTPSAALTQSAPKVAKETEQDRFLPAIQIFQSCNGACPISSLLNGRGLTSLTLYIKAIAEYYFYKKTHPTKISNESDIVEIIHEKLDGNFSTDRLLKLLPATKNHEQVYLDYLEKKEKKKKKKETKDKNRLLYRAFAKGLTQSQI